MRQDCAVPIRDSSSERRVSYYGGRSPTMCHGNLGISLSKIQFGRDERPRLDGSPLSAEWFTSTTLWLTQNMNSLRARGWEDTGHCLGFHCSGRERSLGLSECGGKRFSPSPTSKLNSSRLLLIKQ